MNNEQNRPIDQNTEAEIDALELETLAAGLPIHSGVRAVSALASNQKDHAMNNEQNRPIDQNTEAEIDAIELETLAAGLPIHSGVRGGVVPCF
jgi:hypothetical protein